MSGVAAIGSPAARDRARLVWALALLGGLALGAQAIRLRVAEAAVRSDNGALAAKARPQNGWGRALRAEQYFASGAIARAHDESLAALERTPLPVIALRTLARARDRIGPGAAGERSWQLAAAMGWRDRHTQLWAMLRALSNRDPQVFAMRADALLRTGDPHGRMAAVIRQAMIEPGLRRAFVRRLAVDPRWRPRFFYSDVELGGAQLAGAVLALNDLGATASPPRRQELRGAITGLIAAGRYREALALDRRFVDRSPDLASLIDDGGFELADSDYRQGVTPFDWVIGEGTATLDQSGGSRSMAITTTGDRGQPAVQRYLPLPPGRYRLSYAVKGGRKASESLGFTLQCHGSSRPLGSSPRQPVASADWQERAFEFAVPAGCPLVRLVLGPFPGAPPADALFDDVAIARVR